MVAPVQDPSRKKIKIMSDLDSTQESSPSSQVVAAAAAVVMAETTQRESQSPQSASSQWGSEPPAISATPLTAAITALVSSAPQATSQLPVSSGYGAGQGRAGLSPQPSTKDIGADEEEEGGAEELPKQFGGPGPATPLTAAITALVSSAPQATSQLPVSSGYGAGEGRAGLSPQPSTKDIGADEEEEGGGEELPKQFGGPGPATPLTAAITAVVSSAPQATSQLPVSSGYGAGEGRAGLSPQPSTKDIGADEEEEGGGEELPKQFGGPGPSQAVDEVSVVLGG